MQKRGNTGILVKLLKIELAFLFTAIALNLLFALVPVLLNSSPDVFAKGTLLYIHLGCSVLAFFFLLSSVITLYRLYLSEKAEKADKDAIIYSVQCESEKQKKLINNLTNLYNNIVEYDTYKTEFFSNISHELKTPLTVILGAIQLIDQKHSGMPDDRRKPNKHLQTIKHNCYRLLRLVNNILDISRIDSGYIKLNAINVNIVYLIEEIAQSVVPYAEQKNLRLEFDTEEEEIITAVDIDKIERIILNLLSNAIKFTPQGGKIWVNVRKNVNKVFITVKDTGLGIPENKRSIIFERFRQANTTLTREYEGSGIGLSLVRSFVELHNGTISLISEENEGSEFIIELPLRLCDLSKDHTDINNNRHNKIIEAINIEFSDIYSVA